MVSWLLWSTNIQIAKPNAIYHALDLHYKARYHTQGHKKFNPDKSLTLAKYESEDFIRIRLYLFDS